ncbi:MULTISPECIES: MMPL family transporter [Actinomadura]|uniref:MMPL family transporter n=1 Tax=Actinomadura yumaensis TaxID=111807 RepID=A0ABW2CFJ7_9ACTN|nr:MMPL family transporter [Actinomadura sp. J1-007]
MIEIAAQTSGPTVVVSGVTLIIAVAGLYLAGEAAFSSLATGSIIVVAVAVLSSLTVLPALPAKLGRWTDRPKVPVLWRLTMRPGQARLWPALLRPAIGHPAVTLAVSAGDCCCSPSRPWTCGSSSPARTTCPATSRACGRWTGRPGRSPARAPSTRSR